MSWLADASANKIVKSYIQDFVDVSGNFKVRRAVSETVDTGPIAWSQLGADIDGDAEYDWSGRSVSISGDGTTVAVGAYRNDGDTEVLQNWIGQVRIFEYSGSSWSQVGDDIYGDLGGNEAGWSVSLNGDGTRVAIGLPGADLLQNGSTANDAGQVRVYEYSNSTWGLLGGVIYGESGQNDAGESVSLSSDGTVVAFQCGRADTNGEDTGAVRVYEYNGSSWNKLGSDIGGEQRLTYSGVASLSGDGMTVAIGVEGNDGGGSDAGHIRVFEYNGSSWSQIGSDINGATAGDRTGASVSLNGDGTILADGSRGNNGRARIFERSGNSWVQLGADIDAEASDDQAGYSVSLSSDGTIVAIGAVGNDAVGNNAGHVRIYEYDGSSWNQVGADIDGEAADDQSGFSVSLSNDGTRVVIGGPYNDGGGADAGHARIYNKTGGLVTSQVSKDTMDVSGGIVYFNTNTMKIEDGTVDISGTTWINQGQSGASIASSNQGAFIVESAGTSSSNAVVYVETAGQTEAFSIRENGDLYSANALQHSSDDRRKTNEQYITNATETIKKLSPQIYTKLNDLVQNGGTGTKTESGLIAQEIYYNAPELRHLIHIEDKNGNKLTPQDYDLSGNDIQNDPDYTALGWGNKSAMVDYIGLLAYLIKSNQEQDACIQERQASIDEQAELIKQYQDRVTALENK
jgi:hypothetical protein